MMERYGRRRREERGGGRWADKTGMRNCGHRQQEQSQVNTIINFQLIFSKRIDTTGSRICRREQQHEPGQEVQVNEEEEEEEEEEVRLD